MPDGDRFYRRLIGTGKGWGTAYRIACNGSGDIFLKDAAMKAVADNVRRISPDSMERAIGILHKSFDEERWQKQGLSLSSSNNFSRLEQALNTAGLQGDFDLVKILEKTAKKVFLEHKESCFSISKNELNESFGQTLASEIMDSRFLSRTRDGMMKEQNRSVPEQKEWERRLIKDVKEASRKLIKWHGKQIKKVRKPVTRRIDRNATSNILNRSLPAF
jgi:hypothetical protein